MMQPYEQRFPWNLDWNLLRTFMVVVDRGGITRAADFLGVKQPTISSALKRLEETVGQRLVDRRPSHFSVTAAGQTLYKECSMVFGVVSQIPDLITEASNRVTGHVSIAMASHVVSPHLDGALEAFNSANPDATYSISVAESSVVLSRMRQNRATLGICLMRNRDPSLTSKVLFREYFGLYCGPNHRLFGRKGIRLSELHGEDSVSFQTDFEGGPLYGVTQLRELASLKPELKGISANLPEVRRMIVAGIGIGALPLHVAERDVNLGNLWQLPPYTRIPSVDIIATTNPRRSMNPAEKAFVASLDRLIDETSLEDRTYR
jgi:DNA-binding transcriptional LysR family regulator